jgi:hypothetical protein
MPEVNLKYDLLFGHALKKMTRRLTNRYQAVEEREKRNAALGRRSAFNVPVGR